MIKNKKIIDSLDSILNQPSKFRTKNCAESNDESRGTYDANNYIKFKTLITRQLYMIMVTNTGTAAAQNNGNKKIIFKNCLPFTNCTNRGC